MPDRFHVHTAVTPGRFRRVGKYGSVDRREDCSRCANCVKRRCEYEAYKKVFHLDADLHGCERGVEKPRHLKDTLREIHGRLVTDGVRDEVTLIAGGGIGAKAIICGADLVAVDTPLMAALGCRVCRGAHTDGHAIFMEDVEREAFGDLIRK